MKDSSDSIRRDADKNDGDSAKNLSGGEEQDADANK